MSPYWLTNRRIRFAAILVALMYLVIGLLVLEDYGLSYDEEAQRYNNGMANYNYVIGTDKEMLRNGNEKYHGPAFELLLIGAQKLFHVKEMRAVYLLRHHISFLTFFLSAVIMFLLARGIFKSDRWALFCALIYILSPRFFAEAFYNSKDTPFLAFFTFSLFTLYKFAIERNLKWAFIHALVTGFMIDIRVMGIFVPIASVGLIFYQHLLSSEEEGNWRPILVSIAVYLIAQCAFIVCFWPILWEGPWHHLKAAFTEMSKYHWVGNMRYFGRVINQDHIPWHYLPVWISITVPTSFIILTSLGMVGILSKSLSFARENYIRFRFDYVFLSFLLSPLALIILMESVVYDGWRHVYFLYSPIVLLATRGAQILFEKLRNLLSQNLIVPMVSVFLLAVFVEPLVSIIQYHPFQYVYFNSLSKAVFDPIHEKFEMDYWGLSYKQGLDYLLKTEPSGMVKVKPENPPGYDNRLMLPYSDQIRLEYQDHFPGVGTYLLYDNRVRFRKRAASSQEMVKELMTPSGPALSIYRVSEQDVEVHTVSERFQNFEQEGYVTTRVGDSLNHVECLSLDNPYGFKVAYVVDSLLLEGLPAVRFQADVMSETSTSDFLSVLDITRNGSSIYWRKYWLGFVTYEPGRWESWRWSFDLKYADLQVGDVISTFLWTVDGAECYQDNLKVQFVNYHESDQQPTFR